MVKQCFILVLFVIIFCEKESAQPNSPISMNRHIIDIASDVHSIKSGNWSDPSIWSTGAVPGATDNVYIAGGTTVTYDMDSTAVANLIVGSDTSSTGGWRTSNAKATILNVTGNIKVFTNMSFYAQTSTTLFLIHRLYIQGNLENAGSRFDLRNGTAAPTCLNVINITFYGSINSTVKMGTYSVTNNEFNGITFNKTGGARVILLSDIVCAQGSSAYLTQNALVHFTEGIVQTNSFIFYHLSSTSADMDTGKTTSYIMGSLGRSAGLSSGKTNTFAVGDAFGYRPIIIKSSTPGITSGHAVVVTCIPGNANTGASTFPDGLIDKVSEVRYYKIAYTYLINTPPDTMGFDSFRPSYSTGDGVNAGNQDLRVAYSTDNRASWLTLHDNFPDTTIMSATPTYLRSDTLDNSGVVLKKDGNFVFITLARLKGTTTNSLNNSNPILTLVSPVGGESWQVGSSHNVTWSSSNVNNVKLEYTTDSGTNWITIIASAPASTGSYSWTIPNTPSTRCKIRISDASNSAVLDTSKNHFAIFELSNGQSCAGYDSVVYANKVYHTVKIGTQCWLRENLNIGTRIAGTLNQSNNSIIEKYCYNDDTVNCELYGGLYQWNETMQYVSTDGATGICPSGWHIPTHAEYAACSTFVSGNGNALKAIGQGSGSGTGTNTSGFAGLLAGYRDNGGYFGNLGLYTTIWTSTLYDATYSYDIDLHYNDSAINNNFDYGTKQNGYSIRCLLNLPSTPILYSPSTGSKDVAFPVNLTWNLVTGALSYRLQVAKDSQFTNISFNDSTITSTTKQIGSLAKNTKYFWRVSAINSAGISSWSSIWSFTTISLSTLSITSPSGSELWQVGTSQNITWTSSNVGNVKLEYSTDNGGNWTTIVTSTAASSGSYAWIIPNTISSNCKVRVSDASDTSLYSISGNVFSIEAVPSISLTSPVGGETWQVASLHNITWTSTNVSKVKIEYSTDSGASWSTILGSTAASSGSYSWTIPNTVSTTCKVRISDTSNASLNSISTSVFSIVVASSITLISPNGGESWTVGTIHNITWISSNVSNVKLEYSTDSGTNWTTIISNTGASAGSYNWIVPNTISGNCKVRISDVSNNAINSVSGSVFSIVAAPSITLISPVGGENWQVGSLHNIIWTSINVGNIKAEYSTNEGADWTIVISSTVASSGNYSWTVPNTASGKCKIRISDVSNASVNASTTGIFTIYMPSIALTFPTSSENWLAGSKHTITWSSSWVDSVIIKYSSNSGTDWQNIISLNASTNSYEWTVPIATTFEGLLKIESTANSTISATSPGITVFDYPANVAVANSVSFGDVNTITSYKLYGIPGGNDLAPTEVFTGEAKYDWKMVWDNGNSSNYQVKYDGSSIFNFKPGRGFWVLSKNPASISKQVSRVAIDQSNLYTIPLHNGWNIISNPFEYQVSWSTVMSLNSLASNQVIYAWDGAWSQPAVMVPYSAYYFNNTGNLTGLKIPYNPNPNAVFKTHRKLSQNLPAIALTLNENGKITSSARVVFDSCSVIGLDDNDFFTPPADFELLSLHIQNDSIGLPYKNLLQDSRKEIGYGQEYDIVLKNQLDRDVLISWNISNIVDGQCISLIDKCTGKAFDLRSTNAHTIPRSTANKEFSLVIGSKSFVSSKKLAYTPKEMQLYQNFPNPFNPLTTISFSLPKDVKARLTLYDILGNQIAELVNRELEAGYHEVPFNASRLASGVYLYRINAGDISLTKKMLLIK